MESEKVKEIKERLKEHIDYGNKKYGIAVPLVSVELLNTTLIIIEELEKANKTKREAMVTLFKNQELYKNQNQQLKDRNAELEKENKDYYDRLNNLQTYIDNYEEIWKGNTNNALNKFAKELKEHSTMKIYSLHNACERIPMAIDETLKEFLGGQND